MNDFNNEQVGNHPKVGLSAVNADPQTHSAFPAVFDYVTFNGDYLSLCRFLSKMNSDPDGQGSENDTSHPSYYNEDGTPGPSDGDSCLIDGNRPQASGVLRQSAGDVVDVWTVDLKVPPISGYVGQDWPASCAGWVVEEDEMDYGCDLWIEVTGVSELGPF